MRNGGRVSHIQGSCAFLFLVFVFNWPTPLFVCCLLLFNLRCSSVQCTLTDCPSLERRNQSIFYFMSVHIEVILDKNKKQKHIIIIYTNFPTGLWTIERRNLYPKLGVLLGLVKKRSLLLHWFRMLGSGRFFGSNSYCELNVKRQRRSGRMWRLNVHSAPWLFSWMC